MTLTVQMRSFFLINQMSSTSKLSLLLCFDDFFLSSKTTNFRHVLPQDQISKKKICFCYFVRKTESVTEMTFSGTNLLFYNMLYYKICFWNHLDNSTKNRRKYSWFWTASFLLCFLSFSKRNVLFVLHDSLPPILHHVLFKEETFLQLLHLAKQIANGPIKTLQSFQNWVEDSFKKSFSVF